MPDFTGRDWKERAFTIGIGGPVGSGKTATLLALCKALREDYKCVSSSAAAAEFVRAADREVTTALPP